MEPRYCSCSPPCQSKKKVITDIIKLLFNAGEMKKRGHSFTIPLARYYRGMYLTVTASNGESASEEML